ncbi:alpha/beta hydrolase [Mycobacterium sp. MYCO198283]|uniref:alpha/beta hydrolase n=1 Tax=Mycobacterium sp. MYCO198283 TaxID=2883505 RepID=UPI001E60D4C5|nr:alpha/beta hydrolase [Mycobacterium sp. MYCO198283]MCG5430961.1 alpha/beta hydrolase [Mycobacterium sp. MYCO198283]
MRRRTKPRRLPILTTAAIGATLTANGYRPLTRRGYASLGAFAYGVIVTELPLQTLAAHAGGLLLASRRASARARLVAWLVSALTWLGLVGLDRIGRRADEPLKAALDTGLGIDRRQNSDGLWKRPAPDGATAKRPGAARMLRIYRDYAHDADISYGEFGGANRLDIWRRPDLDRRGKAPVLIQVPGGAWITGSKRGQAHPLLSHLAELGWICVPVNYRLSPRNTWPDHIVDVKRAIAWVKEHIADYGGDPDFVAITGGSAGGHLSSLAALTPNDPQFQPGFEDADTSLRAAVPFYGVYDFTHPDGSQHPLMAPVVEQRVFKQPQAKHPDKYQAASPISYVGPDAPPFFVLHGEQDTLVPVQQGRDFVDALRGASRQPVVYAELPIAQHAFDIFGSPRAAHAAVAVEQFLAEIYAQHLSSPRR